MNRTIGITEAIVADEDRLILSMHGYGPVKRYRAPFEDDGKRHSYPMALGSYWRRDAVASGDGWELGVPEQALPYLEPLWAPLRQHVSEHGGRWLLSLTIESAPNAPETVRRGLVPISEHYTITAVTERALEGEGW